MNLVGDDAITGFLAGQSSERFGLRRRGLGHRVNNGVDLFLGQLGEEGSRLFGATRECSRFVNGGQVAIGLGWGLRHAWLVKPRVAGGDGGERARSPWRP